MKDCYPLISVIVPVYNQQRYIGKCLRSIIGQTYGHLEIIVVNDGSSDDSLNIISHTVALDTRVKIINQENKGVAAARKAGYLCATGAWIVFVDSDDYLPSDSIESLYLIADSKGVDVVCGNCHRKLGPVLRYSNAFPSSMGMRAIEAPELFDSYYVSFFGINLFPVTVWGKLYRKSVIDRAMKEIDIFMATPLHRSEDEAFTMHLFPFLSSVYCLQKPIYVYRFGGITSGNGFLSEMLDFGDYRIGFLDKYQYEKGYSPLFIEYVNILITLVHQGLESKMWNASEAEEWLAEELDNRYLMRRMQNYYLGKTVIPDKCQMVLSHDVDSIVSMAESRLKQQRLRFFLKKVLLRTSNN